MGIDLHILNNPNLHPRDEVRLENVTAEISGDGRRVKVTIAATPFKERPNYEVAIRDTSGKRVAGTSVIAPMHFTSEYHIHLRGVSPEDLTGALADVVLYYESMDEVHDQKTVAIRAKRSDSQTNPSDPTAN